MYLNEQTYIMMEFEKERSHKYMNQEEAQQESVKINDIGLDKEKVGGIEKKGIVLWKDHYIIC